MKPSFINVVIVAFSLLISLFVGEVLFRMVFDPIDFLLAKVEKDPVLNHRIRPGSVGHDSMGFRNLERPLKSDIVAIGDSQTYGVAADIKHSWPATLSRIIGKPVYNMGLGGYGPVHYYYLLKNKASLLQPKTILIGFYFGNDLMDSYNLVYSNDNWKYLRKNKMKKLLDPDVFVRVRTEKKRFLNGLRNWLSYNSILYRVITQSKFFDIFRSLERRQSTDETVTLKIHNVPMIFRPEMRDRFVSMNNKIVIEAISIVKTTFLDIKTYTEENGMRLIVLFIPSKELVHSRQLEAASLVTKNSALKRLFGNERQVREDFRLFFKLNDVEIIDLLPSLSKGSMEEAIYPSNDTHPNAKGYAIIAKDISNYLTEYP